MENKALVAVFAQSGQTNLSVPSLGSTGWLESHAVLLRGVLHATCGRIVLRSAYAVAMAAAWSCAVEECKAEASRLRKGLFALSKVRQRCRLPRSQIVQELLELLSPEEQEEHEQESLEQEREEPAQEPREQEQESLEQEHEQPQQEPREQEQELQEQQEHPSDSTLASTQLSLKAHQLSAQLASVKAMQDGVTILSDEDSVELKPLPAQQHLEPEPAEQNLKPEPAQQPETAQAEWQAKKAAAGRLSDLAERILQIRASGPSADLGTADAGGTDAADTAEGTRGAAGASVAVAPTASASAGAGEPSAPAVPKLSVGESRKMYSQAMKDFQGGKAAWLASEDRARCLEQMPESELKRRKFQL